MSDLACTLTPCQVTKQFNVSVLFEGTVMSKLLNFPHLITENFHSLFQNCASEYFQHLVLDKFFFISTGIAYILNLFSPNQKPTCPTAFVIPKTIVVLILNKLFS